MNEKKRIYKPQSISGFPEWLPETRMVELQWFDHIRRIFESYGFCSIETPSVELLDAINAKGGDGGADTDKEMYIIRHLSREIEESCKEPRMVLHFDQTVPLARYTAQHFNELVFPFKRYQIQRVWRGERPQAGRFREFYQCDIDVINVDQLPMHFDAEMPAIIWQVLSTLPGMENEKFQIRISNRKILIGFLHHLNISNIVESTRIIDKYEKLGERETLLQLKQTLKLDDSQCAQILNLVRIKGSLETLRDIKPCNEIMSQGLSELCMVMNVLEDLPKGSVIADLSIVRGLDYYTGTVYETVFLDDPSYGSICSGGRYEDLAGHYINKHLPGVGISIGFSRLFDRLRQQNKLPQGRQSPADIMVILPSEEQRHVTMKTAQLLRIKGHKVESFHNPIKVGRQLAYAEKKGIPYVWFPPFDASGIHEVKDMRTGIQIQTTPEDWSNNYEKKSL